MMMIVWINCLYTNHELYYYIKDIVCLPSCLYMIMMTPWLSSYNKHWESAILCYIKESLSTTKTGEGVNSKTEMKLSIVLFLAIVVFSVIANCPPEPKGYNYIIQKLRVLLFSWWKCYEFLNSNSLQSICIVVKLQMRRDKISLVLV